MNLPTKITFSRIIAIVLMIIGLFVLSFIDFKAPFFLGDGRWPGINLIYLILFVFFLIASYTDHLDGKLARKNNQVTALGKFLDPVADKLLINSLIIFLAVPNMTYAQGQMTFSLWCAIILVARDIVVDALRFIAAQKGTVIAANIFGKMKTVFEMVAICFVLLNDFPFAFLDWGWPVGLRISDWFVYIATLMSVISGVIYVIQNKDALKE